MKHDKIIDCIEERLVNNYTTVVKRKNYKINKLEGEVDLYAVNFLRKSLFIIEVKETNSLHTLHKAMEQLKKDKRYLSKEFEDFNITTMYAYNWKTKRGYDVVTIK